MEWSQEEAGCARPLGDSTTVIDLADRDDMDDDMFPLAATKSWFTRDKGRRYLNFTPVIQEFVHKGTAEFGGKLTFEIGSVNACDLLLAVGLQIRLNHWLDQDTLSKLESGQYTYADPNSAWYYANGLGQIICAKAEFQIDDQVLETVDGDFSNVFGALFSDINTQFGVAVDGVGRVPIQELINWPETQPFPTTNGFITVILPFSFQRIRLRNGFPLTSCREGTVRITMTLRPFSECVRIAGGVRASCNETPLGKTFVFDDNINGGTVSVVASNTVPQFLDTRLITYGMLVDGKLREAMLKAPFDRMYRELYTFRFTEPQKYTVNTSSNGVVSLQLPLEVNGPCEEIIWFIRRKAVANNNEWTNYSNVLEKEIMTSALLFPQESMLVSANLQVNGISLIDEGGEYFRRQIARNHRGGIVAYSAFIYGYTFARRPGLQNPTGWMNASRSQDVRLRIDVRPPGGQYDLEFEVVVYCTSLNWVRFQNGICNKVFSS
jgi:hypothetical protein